MDAKTQPTAQLRAQGKAASHSRTDIRVRDVYSVIDEPVQRDGTNAGPAPTETALAALIGCTNVIGHKVAHKLGIEMSNVQIRAVCDFNRMGVMLKEEIDVPFEAIRLKVEIDTPASQEEIDELARQVAMYCPLSKLFKQAGTDVTEEWIIRQS